MAVLKIVFLLFQPENNCQPCMPAHSKSNLTDTMPEPTFYESVTKVINVDSWNWSPSRVLREVVEGPARDGVELHEVLEVGDLPLHPLLREAGGAQQLRRRTARRVHQVGQAEAAHAAVHLVAALLRGGKKREEGVSGELTKN